MQKAQTAETFWAKVDQSGECWEWQGYRIEQGYGQVSYHGRIMGAHVLAYRFTHGDIPEGMEVMHTCDNPPCCNPAHLVAGTHQQNILTSTNPAAVNARKSECYRGHAFTPENTRTTDGKRRCRTCARLRQQAFQQRRLAVG